MTRPGSGTDSRSWPSAYLAEVAGTALLLAIGTGAIVAGARVGGVPQWALAVAWFVAVTVPIVLFAKRSGAHLNPVVTMALALAGRFPRRQTLPYVVAQLLGALVGCLLVLVTLGDGARLRTTVPTGSGIALPFAAELLFTFLLVVAVFQIPARVEGPQWRLLLPGLVVGVSTWAIGPISGSSLNPARTLAPAILSGTFPDLWLYLTAVPLGALAAVAAERWLGGRGAGRGPGPARPASRR